MERILVTGGTGVLGSWLTLFLTEAGFTVRIASRGGRRAGLPVRTEWAQVSLARGEGLEQAVRDVDTIIHAASTPFAARQVDTGGARRLLEVAGESGVGHFFYVSIVGVDRHPLAYYRAKLETERVVQAGSLPWTILRATQFHELLDRFFFPALFSLPFIGFVPQDFLFQPIDSREVARRMVELVRRGPSGRAQDIGGPEIRNMGDLARSWTRARGIKKRILPLPTIGAAARAFRSGVNTTPDMKVGSITWEAYLAENVPQ